MNIEILTFRGDFKEGADPAVWVIKAKLDTQVFHFEERKDVLEEQKHHLLRRKRRKQGFIVMQM